MTMPHLMNCPHSPDGWCLSCVKELWDEKQKLEDAVRPRWKAHNKEEKCSKCDRPFLGLKKLA